MSTREKFLKLQNHLNQQIVGQEALINRMLIALLADGHLLVEGAPGLAKTKAIKELSLGLEGEFHRIQFTPDLLPGDVTGTEIYRPQDGTFSFQKGPIFYNLILADEINRAPAKVQSALLEAMAERQVTVGRQTYPLPELFLVMATQNPIEQEGTYPLPEAQLDRFLLHVRIGYPNVEAEHKILQIIRNEIQQTHTGNLLTQEVMLAQQDVFDARQALMSIHLSDALEQYLVQIVIATRDPHRYGDDLKSWVSYGASPRATIALDRCAKAHAWLQDRDYVSPEDIQAMMHDVCRHRIILSFEAEANGITTDHFINELVSRIAVP